MNRQHVLALCAIATLTFTGTAPAAALQNPGDPVEFDVQGGRIRVVTVADGLVHPWSIAFLPDGGMLVVESPGRLRAIRNGTLDPAPVWTAPSSDNGGGQLKAVAVHPGFTENRLVYLSYPKRDAEGRSTLAVARGRLDGRTLTEVGDIFVAEAWETGGNIAGRIFFGPDRMLYVAIGDRDRLCCIGREDPSLRIKAQYLGNHIGKVLRIRDDGGVPADNPFVDVPHALPEIFTYGHRNTYGFTIHPETGDLWQAEIGPMGGDEVNILAPGGNYGWPPCVDGTQLQRLTRFAPTLGTRGYGQSTDLLGSVDQSVQHRVLHGRSVSRLAGEPAGGCAQRPATPTRFVQPTVTGRAAGDVAGRTGHPRS